MIFNGNSIAVDERSRCDQRWGWSFLKMIKLMTNDPYRMSCEKCRTMGEQYSIVKPRRAGASEESFWKMPAWPHSSTPQSTPAATSLVGPALTTNGPPQPLKIFEVANPNDMLFAHSWSSWDDFSMMPEGCPRRPSSPSLLRSVGQLVNEWKTRKVTGFHLHYYIAYICWKMNELLEEEWSLL